MDEYSRYERLRSKMKTARDIPVFSDAQIEAFYSDSVDSLDEALAVLDETNQTTIGEPNPFPEGTPAKGKSGT